MGTSLKPWYYIHNTSHMPRQKRKRKEKKVQVGVKSLANVRMVGDAKQCDITCTTMTGTTALQTQNQYYHASNKTNLCAGCWLSQSMTCHLTWLVRRCCSGVVLRDRMWDACTHTSHNHELTPGLAYQKQGQVSLQVCAVRGVRRASLKHVPRHCWRSR